MTSSASNLQLIKQRWILVLSCDGSRFFGQQKQTEGIPAVQAELEPAINKVVGESISVTVAGRTDTDVHAVTQVVRFNTTVFRPSQTWVRGVSTYLLDGMVVLCAQAAQPHFHARFDAFGRRYRYLLQSAPARPPLMRGRAGQTHLPLNLERIRQAAASLVGEHDFSSFRATEYRAKSPVKTTYSTEIGGRAEWLHFDIHDNAFSHHIVRNTMGALVYVGYERLDVG